MYFLNTQDIASKTIIDGYHAKFIHSKNMTLAFWEIEENKSLPEHSHKHEQVAQMIEGEFEMTIEGKTQILRPGNIAIIPSNARHSGRAITNCKILDVFYPIREEYK
ncbi:MAG: cupin domain-containing protein [Bacteroidetes bacterium HGW-Bacteroidetes-1]|jgi:quercetin dioxygenase-like cupin family protein|nr:MAG: cupin domain-containing protein [Bacteroidetes bacterium HGW-Bacteroidetes-1]